jgi:hypothetical protein
MLAMVATLRTVAGLNIGAPALLYAVIQRSE